jgi:DNA ligase-1
VNSTDILLALDQIAATSSRTEKERLLEIAITHPLTQMVVKQSYDPFITFGLTPPRVESDGTQSFDDTSARIWGLLHGLATRKITGGEAHELVRETMSTLNQPSAELLWRILSKDLRCGITEKTVNRVLPGTIPVFDVMLAHKFEEKRIKEWPVAVEPKLDGVRVICLVKDGTAKFFSRTGKPFPAVEHLGDPVAKMIASATANLHTKVPTDKLREVYSALLGSGTHTIALDGEVVSGNFNKTVGDVRRKDAKAEDAEYHVFDAVPYKLFTGDAQEFKAKYKLRREFLRYIVDNAPGPQIKKTERYYAETVEEVQGFYQSFRDRGLEGAIVKPLDGTYVKKRSHAWLKLKNEDTEDLRVTGAFEGTGKYAGKLGGLIVDREGVEVRVGGGFSDQQREEFWRAWCHDAGHPMHGEDHALWHPQLLGRLIEVEYHEVTPDGSLRHPRFVKFRDDKDPKLSVKEAAE